jgi:WS/DGAT/MGAT family acyltransferase
VDDAEFDIGRHLRRVACPPPGDERALLGLAADLVTQPLPWSRPLWSAMLVTALSGGGAALIVVFHHVLADGIGGLAVLAALADGMPASVAGPFPEPAPLRRELIVDAWRSRLRALRRLPQVMASVLPVLGDMATRPTRAERSSLNRPTGPRRRLAVVQVDLTRIHQVCHREGATINDGMLAAVVGALSTVLAGRGERLGTVVVSMPVSTRRAATATQLGNHTGVLPVGIPTDTDVVGNLARIAAITRASKASKQAASAGPLFRAMGAVGAIAWFMNHQRMVHTFVTNLRGPAEPLHLGGATVSAVLPVSATTGNVTVAFAALSYAGRLIVTVIADPDAVPDMSALTASLQDEFNALAAG